MVAAARHQALGLDRGQEAAGGAVIEQGGWRFGDVAHFHLGAAMALGGADAAAIVGEGETALVIGLDHFTQGVQVEGMTLPAGAVDQRVDIGPAVAVEGQVDGFGGVAQHVAEELAEGVALFLVHWKGPFPWLLVAWVGAFSGFGVGFSSVCNDLWKRTPTGAWVTSALTQGVEQHLQLVATPGIQPEHRPPRLAYR